MIRRYERRTTVDPDGSNPLMAPPLSTAPHHHHYSLRGYSLPHSCIKDAWNTSEKKRNLFRRSRPICE